MELGSLPIKKLILYQNGIGWVERRAVFSTDAPLMLSFPEDQMNDILKSLSIFDSGRGKVRGVSFETGEDLEKAIAERPIRLGAGSVLQDLINSSRGYPVHIRVGDQEGRGQIIGLDSRVASKTEDDEEPHPHLVLLSTSGEVQHLPLDQLQSFQLDDPFAASDLEYFLEASRSLKKKGSKFMTIYLEGEQHDLTLAYLTTMPAWKISYRLLFDPQEPRLQAWGIVDNRLPEDLGEVDLTLVSGMPLSFIYEIYSPASVRRQYVHEDRAGLVMPLSFDEGAGMESEVEYAPPPVSEMPTYFEREDSKAEKDADIALTQGSELTTTVDSEQIDLKETFQYNLERPISIKRGQSALVPLFDREVACEKQYLYNEQTCADGNPLITMNLSNNSGSILDRGPITVVDEGLYVGEAVLPFTTHDADNRIAYATELNIECEIEDDDDEAPKGFERFNDQDHYLQVDTWKQYSYIYKIENRKGEGVTMVVEHARHPRQELYDVRDPDEETTNFYRWKFEAKAQFRTLFEVKQQEAVRQSREIRHISPKDLAEYEETKLMEKDLFDFVSGVVDLQQQINTNATQGHRLSQQVNFLDRELERLDQGLGVLSDPDRIQLLENRSMRTNLDGYELLELSSRDLITDEENALAVRYKKAIRAHKQRVARRRDCTEWLEKMNSHLEEKIRKTLNPKADKPRDAPKGDLTNKIQTLLAEDLAAILVNPGEAAGEGDGVKDEVKSEE